MEVLFFFVFFDFNNGRSLGVGRLMCGLTLAKIVLGWLQNKVD